MSNAFIALLACALAAACHATAIEPNGAWVPPVHSPDGLPPHTFVPETGAHSGLPFWQHHEHPMTRGEVEGLPESAKGTTHNLHPNPEAAENSGGAPPTPEEKAAADNKAMLRASSGESSSSAPKRLRGKSSKSPKASKPPPSINQHTAGGAPVHGANTMLLEKDSKNPEGHLQLPIAGGPMNGHEGGGLHTPPEEQMEQPPHGGLPAWMAHTHPFQRGHVPGQVYNNHIHEHKKMTPVHVPLNAHYPPVGTAIHAAPHMLMPLTPGRR